MDKVLQALRVAKTTLDLVPVSVPGLGPAVELAVNILELAQGVKDTHDDCKSLAMRAAQFTNDIYQQLNDSPASVDITSSKRHLATLLCTLQDIENLMKRQSRKREKILLIVRKDKVKQQVAELHRRLDDACRLFGIQSSIAVEGRLDQIATTQIDLVQHAENSTRVADTMLKRQNSIKQEVAQMNENIITLMRSVTVSQEGGMMVFSKEEISLVRELDPSQEAATYEEGVPESERIVRWQARIRSTKESVIVAKFPRRDERFRAAIELSKKTMHPHVAQILGFSRSDCEHAFVVLEGLQDQRPIEDFIQSVHGIKKYMWTAEVAKELQSAFSYIARQGFLKPDLGDMHSDTVRPHQLYVTPEGAVRWDIYSWTHDGLPMCVDMSDGYIELSPHLVKLIEGFSIRDVERALESPVPIQRARALLNLWDKLMEFADFNRDKFYCFVPDEDVPWIGSCTQDLAFEALTPEGVILQYTIDPAAVCCSSSFGTPHCFPFDEDEPETEYTNIPTDLYVHEIYAPEEQEWETDVMSRVSKTKSFPGWRRHTVLDMDYDVCFRTLQTIEEDTKCRSFFMDQAVNLDFSRYLDRDGDVMMGSHADLEEDFLPTVVYGLHFITTSHLVGLSPMRIGRPPRKLYFYERLHDAENVIDFETPWGYWSTEAKPIRNFPGYEATREEMRKFIKTQKLEIQYLGYSREFKFAWLQSVAGFVFRIEVMIAVESYHWTKDERLLLRELQQSLAAAYASNPGSKQWEIRKSVRRKRDEHDDGEQSRGEDRAVQRRRTE